MTKGENLKNKVLDKLGIKEEEVKVNSCKDCVTLLDEERPETIYDTDLCAYSAKKGWSDDVINAIVILKKNEITTDDYGNVRMVCKGKNG